jgi:hypothetical protein
LVSRPHLPEEGPINADPIPTDSGAPEAAKNQDGDEAEDSLEESDSTTSPPPANSEDKSLEKKRKCIEDLASSSTSIPIDASEGPLLPRTPNFRHLNCLTREFVLSSLSKYFYLRLFSSS